MLSTGAHVDAFGYNATSGRGHYIKGTGATYVYGGGTFFDGSSIQTLYHTGTTTATFAGAVTASSVTADQINLKDGGDYITFYGGDETNHSITSRDAAGTVSDDLRINTYGALYINLDSNNNNTSGADFLIGRHGSNASTISTLFTLSGETGNATFTGDVTGVTFRADNNESYYAKDSSGTSRRLIRYGTDDNVYIGNQIGDLYYQDPSGTHEVYHEGHKPTLVELGALSTSGGTMTGALELGVYASTVQGVLKLNGSTANKRSVIKTTNGNLHIDAADGHAMYLNYYSGGTTANVIFGSGNGGGSGASVSSTGVITATGGTSTQWNTAYTYSTVGHLPLAGGTLTGTLNVNDVNIPKANIVTHGSYFEMSYGKSNTSQFTFNADYDGLETGAYTPNYSGTANAGMSVVKMPSGGVGGLDFYVKKHGTTSGSHALSTFTKILSLHQDGYSTFVGNISTGGTITATGGNSTQWNTAYGWGNHAGSYLSLGGGTMSGDVDMGGNRITEGVFETQEWHIR